MFPFHAGKGEPQAWGSPRVILGLHLEKVNTKILRHPAQAVERGAVILIEESRHTLQRIPSSEF